MLPPRRLFRNFFTGRAGDRILVATLSRELGLHISAQTENVMLERSYAQKLLVKHRMTYEQLTLIQQVIDEGYCLAGTKPNFLEFIWFDTTPRQSEYLLVLKSARWGQELWIVSFHRTNAAQCRSKQRRQRLLRDRSQG